MLERTTHLYQSYYLYYWGLIVISLTVLFNWASVTHVSLNLMTALALQQVEPDVEFKWPEVRWSNLSDWMQIKLQEKALMQILLLTLNLTKRAFSIKSSHAMFFWSFFLGFFLCLFCMCETMFILCVFRFCISFCCLTGRKKFHFKCPASCFSW